MQFFWSLDSVLRFLYFGIKVNKISKWGYSVHLRLLKLNKLGLCYYNKEIPNDFVYSSDVIQTIQKDKDKKPKQVIPLGKILAVSDLTE